SSAKMATATRRRRRCCRYRDVRIVVLPLSQMQQHILNRASPTIPDGCSRYAPSQRRNFWIPSALAGEEQALRDLHPVDGPEGLRSWLSHTGDAVHRAT